MQHQTLYRKYRPQNFEELKGQSHVVDLLKSALINNKINHAYLFSGGRGTGKTSTARILARELGTNNEDIYEIDAASNRGIDEVRAIRESVYTLPLSSKYKIYIIDEAHMLTPQAANALLKTLEEPPSHVIFILATTDKHKLPVTILSRLQTVDFKKADVDTLSELVETHAQKEGLELESGVARLIAQKGDGSYRDTFSLLEKYSTQSGGNKITLELVIGSAQSSPKINALELVEYLASNNIQGALDFLQTKIEATFSDVFVEVIEALRSCLLLRFNPGETQENLLLDVYTKNEIEKLQKIGMQTTNPVTAKMLASALETMSKIKKDSTHAKVLVEIFFMESMKTK